MMLKCNKCGRYTILDKCPECKSYELVDPHPPKFSPQDKYLRIRFYAILERKKKIQRLSSSG
jgi:H/ACA ribonucleoprotein complex subunit 3